MLRFRTTLLATSALLATVATQPASAADLAVKAPPAVPVISRWDGLYASLSAGGTWTDPKSSGAANTIFRIDGVPVEFETFSENLTGKDIGAVFTFGMGYNVVWGRWLAGIQSEVSYNKTLLNAAGSSTTITNTLGPISTTIQDVRADIERNWTISEMARIGYLVAPDWLVYGLVGWSWSGFDYRAAADNRQVALPFTLSGITWGAGVEKDFGWVRAFIQYKGIDFGSKSVSLPNFTNATFINAGVGVETFQAAGPDVRRLSAVAQEFTAGVTIPINFQRSPVNAWAGELPVTAAVPVVRRWDGLYAGFSAGSAWTKAKSSEVANTSTFFNGVLGESFALTDDLSGKDVGAVFTFGMGYNVLWGRWLAGIQSEVSYNKTLIDAKGVSNSVDNNVFLGNTIRTSEVRADVERKWTVSEMARLGYLVAPDWLVYGLVGWSWSGFDFRSDFNNIQNLPYTLNGITWGAGVEKDFGWLRAFVQYKGIDFGGKGVNLPIAFSRFGVNGANVSFSQITGNDVRRLSAVAQEITAGVTIPINFYR